MKTSAVILGMLLAGSALAETGLNGSGAGKTVELTGMIQQAFYEQPQAYITLKTSDQTWKVLLAPPARLQERDLRRATLAPGMRVSVEGVPDAGAAKVLKASSITVHDGPSGNLDDKTPLESTKPLEAKDLEIIGESSGVTLPAQSQHPKARPVPQQ